MKANSLADLKHMQAHLAEQQRLRQEREAQARAGRGPPGGGQRPVSRAVGKVQRLPETGRVPAPNSRQNPLPSSRHWTTKPCCKRP